MDGVITRIEQCVPVDYSYPGVYVTRDVAKNTLYCVWGYESEVELEEDTGLYVNRVRGHDSSSDLFDCVMPDLWCLRPDRTLEPGGKMYLSLNIKKSAENRLDSLEESRRRSRMCATEMVVITNTRARIKELESHNRGLHGTIAEMDSEIYEFNKVKKRLCKDREGLEADNFRIVRANVDLSKKIEKLESDFNANCSTIDHQGKVIRDQQENIIDLMSFYGKHGYLKVPEVFDLIAKRGARIADLEAENAQLREARQARINDLSELRAKITSLESGATGTGPWRIQTGENCIHITRPGGFQDSERSE